MEKCIQFLQQCEEVEAFQQQIIMGALLWTCKQTSKHGVEMHIIFQNQEIQKCAFYWQSDVSFWDF
jgi:hypothetical protein